MQVITKLMGGLGNQMFQYAAGRALALRLGAELKLDTSWFETIAEVDTPRCYMLGEAFSVPVGIAKPEECERLVWVKESFAGRVLQWLSGRPRSHAASYVAEPSFAHWPGFESITVSAYLLGYWQNERYFEAFAKEICQDFTFPKLPSKEAHYVAERVKTVPHSVSIHIRRGDYVSNPQTALHHGLCSERYYTDALAHIHRAAGHELSLFLFSDDPEWVHDNFDTQGFQSTVVDFHEHAAAPWHDMHLMRLCRHHIIANSSFSWWGAWFSQGSGLTITPAYWFTAPEKKNSNPSPASWIRL